MAALATGAAAAAAATHTIITTTTSNLIRVVREAAHDAVVARAGHVAVALAGHVRGAVLWVEEVQHHAPAVQHLLHELQKRVRGHVRRVEDQLGGKRCSAFSQCSFSSTFSMSRHPMEWAFQKMGRCFGRGGFFRSATAAADGDDARASSVQGVGRGAGLANGLNDLDQPLTDASRILAAGVALRAAS